MARQNESQEPNRKAPSFKDEAEAAGFWDSHSPLDYPQEFREAQVRFARPLVKRGLTIKLSEATMQQLREIAQEQGLGLSTLVRMWILERLKAAKDKQNVA